MDLDNFKSVNDQHGHARGDAVLREAADLMRANLRSFELVYRVGGEEFLVLMPGVDRQGGSAVAERLRQAVRATEIPAAGSVTVSIGLAEFDASTPDARALFAAADSALYEAKRAGRDRVCCPADARDANPTAALGVK
jgi:diguanylate cyclase (GGDEF)-like protein